MGIRSRCAGVDGRTRQAAGRGARSPDAMLVRSYRLTPVLAAAPKAQDRRARRRRGWTTSTWTPRRPRRAGGPTPRRRTSTAAEHAAGAAAGRLARFRRPTRRASTPGSVHVVFRYRDLRQNRRRGGSGPHRAIGRPADRYRSSAYVVACTYTFAGPCGASWASELLSLDDLLAAPISSQYLKAYGDGGTDRQGGRWRGQARRHRQRRAQRPGGRGGAGHCDHQRPGGQSGRVRHRTVHRQPAVERWHGWWSHLGASTAGWTGGHRRRRERASCGPGRGIRARRAVNVGGRWSTRRVAPWLVWCVSSARAGGWLSMNCRCRCGAEVRGRLAPKRFEVRGAGAAPPTPTTSFAPLPAGGTPVTSDNTPAGTPAQIRPARCFAGIPRRPTALRRPA